MSRRLLPLAAVLALGAAPSLASFTPAHGHYGGDNVTFHYAHGEIVGFKYRAVHVCLRAWVGHDHAFTCHHSGKFVSGKWTSATSASGDYVYERPTSRGPVRITLRWTADLQP